MAGGEGRGGEGGEGGEGEEGQEMAEQLPHHSPPICPLPFPFPS